MKIKKENLKKIYYAVGAIVLVATAIWLYTVFTNKPLTYYDHIQKAKAYTEKGQLAFAVEEYNKILDKYPKSDEAYINIAEIYLKINETEHAKIQYIKAIRIGGKNQLKAYIKLAELYCQEKKYQIAEDIIQDIKDSKKPDVLKAIGDIYYCWGNNLKSTDKPESIRKFKQAVYYYNMAESKAKSDALNSIFSLYASISDDLTNTKQYEQAINILKISLAYQDNALAHYKLARISESTGKNTLALKEYKKAYSIDSDVAPKNSYINLLMRSAAEAKSKGNKVTAEYYYTLAKKLDKKLSVPLNPNSKILFNLVSTSINEDMDNDIIVPGISFRLTNIGNQPVKNMKMKVIFLKGGKPHSTQTYIIATEKNPLKADSSTKKFSVYTNAPIKHVFDNHKLNVKVYLSMENSPNWRLFRNVDLKYDRKSILLVK